MTACTTCVPMVTGVWATLSTVDSCPSILDRTAGWKKPAVASVVSPRTSRDAVDVPLLIPCIPDIVRRSTAACSSAVRSVTPPQAVRMPDPIAAAVPMSRFRRVRPPFSLGGVTTRPPLSQ